MGDREYAIFGAMKLKCSTCGDILGANSLCVECVACNPQDALGVENELEKWFNKWHRKVVTGRCLIELKNMYKKFIRLLEERQKV